MQETFSSKEVGKILERAAELEQRPRVLVRESTQFSYLELQRIAEEAGISTESLRGAIQEVHRPRRSTLEAILGGPRSVERTLVINRPLTDTDRERLLSIAREHARTVGRHEQLGATTTWVGGLGNTMLELIAQSTANGSSIVLRARFDALLGGLFGGLGGGLGGGTSYLWVSACMALLGNSPSAVVLGLGLSMSTAFLLARTVYASVVKRKILTIETIARDMTRATERQDRSPRD